MQSVSLRSWPHSLTGDGADASVVCVPLLQASLTGERAARSALCVTLLPASLLGNGDFLMGSVFIWLHLQSLRKFFYFRIS